MLRRRVVFGSALLLLCVGRIVWATVPGAIDVTCDVDRDEFRRDAVGQTQVCFRLWTARTGGAPVGGAHCLPLADLTVVRVKTETFGGQRSRSFVRIGAVIGSDQNPILSDGQEAWLEMAVGPQVLGCEMGAGTSSRRRIQSTLFARVSDGPTGSGLPTGSMMPFGGVAAPPGWLVCDGSAISRAAYPMLFAVIGTAYGAGDGISTFNLPDVRGRVLVGKGTHADVDAVGDNEGLAVGARRPAHSHVVNSHSHAHPHAHHVEIWSGGEAFSYWSPSHRYPKGSTANYDNFAHGHAVIGWTSGPDYPMTSAESPGTSAQAPSFLAANYLIKY